MEARKRKETEFVQLSLRIRESLRRSIEKAADENGCSLNEEMTRRLEESFNLEERYGAPHVRDIAQTVAGMIRVREAQTGKSCNVDLETFRSVQMAMAGFFGLPFGDVKMYGDPKKWKPAWQAGEEIARDALMNLGGIRADRVGQWIKTMRTGETK